MKKNPNFKIRVLKRGGYQIIGKIPLNTAKFKAYSDKKSDRKLEDLEYGEYYDTKDTYYLCRCGHSKKKPFCDGEHVKKEFEGEEFASKEPFVKQAKHYVGETIDLLYQKNICIGAGFCNHLDGAWRLTFKSSQGDNEKHAIKQACDCPTGSIAVLLKDGVTIVERDLSQEITLIDNKIIDVLGPLWVKGGILIEDSNGEPYEVRNRVTLCRCGESEVMPFCDASHHTCEHMKLKDKV